MQPGEKELMFWHVHYKITPAFLGRIVSLQNHVHLEPINVTYIRVYNFWKKTREKLHNLV